MRSRIASLVAPIEFLQDIVCVRTEMDRRCNPIRDTWVSITVLSVITFEATPCSCCEGRYYYQPKRRDKPGSWMGNKH